MERGYNNFKEPPMIIKLSNSYKVYLIPILALCLALLFGSNLYASNGCDKAEESFNKAINLPESDDGLIQKVHLYKNAISLCPSHAKAYNNLGDTYEKQGRFDEAISNYKKASQIKPDLSIAYFGVGDVYRRTNQYVEAIEWYKNGLTRINKEDNEAKLTKYYMASIDQMAEDLRKRGVISADTIEGLLSSQTRGIGTIESITFGEGNVPFDYNKFNIRNDAKPQLDEIGKALSRVISKDINVYSSGTPGMVIEIAGHTDDRGTDEYNLQLSNKRAESLINYLVSNFNIPRSRLKAKGYGERIPLCQGASESCYGFNRRVEVAKKPFVESKSGTRSLTRSFRDPGEKSVKLELGVLYSRGGSNKVSVLKSEETTLHSGSDKIFFFFRPLQDSYVHILQEDSKGNLFMIYPMKGKDAYVRSGRDYWTPGFGKAFTLDNTVGEEKIYVLATSWPLKSELSGLSFTEYVKSTMRGLNSRAIHVVAPSAAPPTTLEEISSSGGTLDQIIERIEGEDGWVRIIKFNHK